VGGGCLFTDVNFSRRGRSGEEQGLNHKDQVGGGGGGVLVWRKRGFREGTEKNWHVLELVIPKR